MKIERTAIPEVLIIEPRVFGDERGFFFESFNERAWQEATGLNTKFVQELALKVFEKVPMFFLYNN